ncbi:sensor histidine kinase [Natrarchaeobius oligotrophus]|uniref:histidine kinase n=1 Tax=Natrarchaeobius chitinivorans TaxID=1679083 RepID=A0A3N6NKZ8_NATCH|nr:HAMP domain-containing sensor histidine kinase [Natrarchaeobius chitinivorans]RQG99992.1 hybrid sensor histidine kinase/response regulator [Natrarchaeobius chitinivorans]
MSSKPNSVQLLVDDDANREALSDLLADRYAVRTDRTELDAALYLVDCHSFPNYRDRLETLKAESSPSFVPVVLVRREETRLKWNELEGANADGPSLVDEVITAPVRKPVLVRRLSNLLVRRRQFQRLKAQNERLDRFASVVSHDLRNPLQVAQGRLELLESVVPEDEREHADVARASLERMEALVDDVLALAREGERIDDPSAVPLVPIAEDAWRLVETPDAKIALPDEPATIAADRDRLSSVFENLFRNAIEHGGNDVTVEVGTSSTGFYVADDGPGIPPERRDEILERGYSSKPSGTGFGLDIVRTVIDAHGWELTVGESDRGGARFDVTGVDRSS